MKKFEDKLIDLLESLPKFVDEKTGNILRNEVVNSALKIDKELISLLIKDKEIKEKFFTEISGYWIFEINKFVDYVQDKEFLDDTYTKFKNKIGLTIDNKFIGERGEVALSFPFKDCILEGGMTKEDEKRNEIFFNEVLAEDQINRLLDPKVLTNFKRYSAKGEESVTEFKRDKEGVIKENLIIKGNNLLALYSLKEQFQGKIKLIYIDPPYNIGNDSFKYNDSFNHSTWLTFMKNRLEIARELLKEDGVIFVQCDDNEASYLKVLMDEIFHRENFISSISWQRAPEGRTVLGQSATFIINSKEEILVYAKNMIKLSKGMNTKKRADATEKALNQYDMFFEMEGARKLVKEIKDKSENIIKIFEHSDYKLEKIPPTKSIKDRIQNFEKLSRIAAQQEESSLQQKILSELDKNKLYSVEYIPKSGKYKGLIKKSFYFNGGIILSLKDYAETDGKRIYRIYDMNDFWSNDEIQVTGISQEGNVTLRRGKKPEKLIQRIIDLATTKNDIVLDFFLGSGTTCSVAHKMGRQYIGIEQLNYGENASVVRLKNVIGQEKSRGKLTAIIEDYDESGISREVRWKGGGEFIYCELMKFNEKAIEIINNAQDMHGLLKIWGEMCEKYFLDYNVEVKKFNDNVEEFKELQIGDQKKVLIEMLNKNQLYVNLSEINDSDFKVSKEDKELNKKFYSD